MLAGHFAGRYAGKLKGPQPEFSGDARTYLVSRNWPGNVRELMHLVEGGVVSCENDVIRVEDLVRDEDPAFASGLREEAGGAPGQGTDKLAAVERKVILHALHGTNWKISGADSAAAWLGIGAQRLRSRMRVHGLKRPT